MSKPWRRYRIGMAAVSFVLLVAALMGYVQWSINRNNQRQCAVISSFTEPPPRPPAGAAQTLVGEELQRYNRQLAERQARQLALLAQLRHDYNCPEVTP